MECERDSKRSRQIVTCHRCGKQFSRATGEIKHKNRKSNLQFCSSSCSCSHYNSIRSNGRRSKCEKMLFDLIVSRFPHLEIIASDRTLLDGLEADISIPALKLAIEWNGVVHLPTFKNETTENSPLPKRKEFS